MLHLIVKRCLNMMLYILLRCKLIIFDKTYIVILSYSLELNTSTHNQKLYKWK